MTIKKQKEIRAWALLKRGKLDTFGDNYEIYIRENEAKRCSEYLRGYKTVSCLITLLPTSGRGKKRVGKEINL